jgi:hypothetical protein
MASNKLALNCIPFLLRSNTEKKFSLYLLIDLNLREKATFGLLSSPFNLTESSVSGA